jgi:hypothetical protein
MEELHHGGNELRWCTNGEAVEVKDEAKDAVHWCDQQFEKLVPSDGVQVQHVVCLPSRMNTASTPVVVACLK